MNRVNFGKVSGVIVDVCKAHGTWFDPGELTRVVAFAAAGGLERTRAREKLERRDVREPKSRPSDIHIQLANHRRGRAAREREPRDVARLPGSRSSGGSGLAAFGAVD